MSNIVRQKDGKEETQLTWTSRQWVRLPGTCPAKLSSALWNQTCCKWKWRKCSVPLALEAMMCEKWLKDQGPFNPKGGKFEGTRCPALRGWHEAGAEVSSRLRGAIGESHQQADQGPKEGLPPAESWFTLLGYSERALRADSGWSP